MSLPGRGSGPRAVTRLATLLPRWLAAVVDQGLIAVSNLAMSVAMARAGGVGELGVYTLVFTAMVTTLGVTRMLVTEPWLASRTAAGVPPSELRSVYVAAASVSALATEAVAILSSGGRWEWLLAAPITLSWILQDFGRYAAYKQGRPGRALFSDTAALAGTIMSLAASFVVEGRLSVVAVLIAWLVGNLCGLLGIVREILGPMAVRGVITWWMRVCRGLAVPLVHESAAYMVGANVSLYALAAVSSNREVGLVRIVSSVFSPVALAFTGLSMWLVPTLARVGNKESDLLKSRVAVYLGLLGLPLLALAVAVGPRVTVLVFGVDTPPSRLSLLVGGLAACAVAIGSPWVSDAKVRNRYVPIAWARTAGAAVILAGILAIPALQGPAGYFALLLLQNLAILVVARFLCTRPGRVADALPHDSTTALVSGRRQSRWPRASTSRSRVPKHPR